MNECGMLEDVGVKLKEGGMMVSGRSIWEVRESAEGATRHACGDITTTGVQSP